jgi:hypothetical protein
VAALSVNCETRSPVTLLPDPCGTGESSGSHQAGLTPYLEVTHPQDWHRLSALQCESNSQPTSAPFLPLPDSG